jgi:hypothetical protein
MSETSAKVRMVLGGQNVEFSRKANGLAVRSWRSVRLERERERVCVCERPERTSSACVNSLHRLTPALVCLGTRMQGR